jgi:hypothetical protein
MIGWAARPGTPVLPMRSTAPIPRAARPSNTRAAPNGTAASISSAAAYSTRTPARPASSRARANNRVLPIPASPSTKIAPPRPARAAALNSTNIASSASRSINMPTPPILTGRD